MNRSRRKLSHVPRLLPCLLLLAAALPVAAEPPPAAEKLLAETRQRLKQVSATEFELDGIRINAATREVRLPTVVQIRQAPIEYLLVHETGKTHESVLTTAVSPTAIQLALLLANHQPATEGLLAKVPEAERPKIWKEEPPAKPGANRLTATVEWQAGGERKTAPLATWVQNSDTRKPPADLTHWIFNGSYIDERGFAAQTEGSIIAVWLDRSALINSPAEGNWRDDLWISLPANIPPEGTPVTLVLAPVAP